MKKKILFLSADYGAGHKSAVEAIRQALEKHHPNEFEYEIIDVPSLLGTSIDKVAEVFYKNSVTYAKPTWKVFFEITDKVGSVDPDKNFYRFIKPSLKPIAEANPDIVIACFPLIFYSVSRYLKELGINIPFISLVTDTGQVHINWVSKYIDYYLAPTTDTAFFLEDRNIDRNKIKVFGFPVKQNFYQKYSIEKAREKYLIPKQNKVIIYFSGAWGAGRIAGKVLEMDDVMEKTTFLVVCGNNKRLQKKLGYIKFRNDVKALGFIDDVAELLATADLVVSKAGGISVMEIITVKKPIIIAEINPGQEEPNARFVESMGFGYVEKKPEELAKRVKFLFEYNDISRLKKNLADYHLNEHSDRDIANFIVSLTEDSEAKKFHLFSFFER